MDKNENIMQMYNNITVPGLKGEVIKAISNKTGLTLNSVKQNWISNEQIPVKHQDTVVEILQNAHTIQTQHINNIETNL